MGIAVLVPLGTLGLSMWVSRCVGSRVGVVTGKDALVQATGVLCTFYCNVWECVCVDSVGAQEPSERIGVSIGNVGPCKGKTWVFCSG